MHRASYSAGRAWHVHSAQIKLLNGGRKISFVHIALAMRWAVRGFKEGAKKPSMGKRLSFPHSWELAHLPQTTQTRLSLSCLLDPCTKRQNELYSRFSWLLFVNSLFCFGSMAQGSRAGTSGGLWKNSFQISIYCTVHFVSLYCE